MTNANGEKDETQPIKQPHDFKEGWKRDETDPDESPAPYDRNVLGQEEADKKKSPDSPKK